jgi:hypothetical protein
MKKVELYVRTEEQLLQDVYSEKGCEHTATGQWDPNRPHSKLGFVKNKTLPERDKKALEIVQEIANERGWMLELHDVSSLAGKISAHLKGIDQTPTILIGGSKIQGIPDKEELLSSQAT